MLKGFIDKFRKPDVDAHKMAVDAAKTGDLAGLKRAYSYDRNSINAKNPKSVNWLGSIALYEAIKGGHYYCVRFMLEHKVNVDVESFFAALKTLDHLLIETLIANGADLNLKSSHHLRVTPAQYLGELFIKQTDPEKAQKCLDCLCLLVEKGAEVKGEFTLLEWLYKQTAKDGFAKWQPFVQKAIELVNNEKEISKCLLDTERPWHEKKSPEYTLELLKNVSKIRLSMYLPRMAEYRLPDCVKYIIDEKGLDKPDLHVVHRSFVNNAFVLAAKSGCIDCVKLTYRQDLDKDVLNRALAEAVVNSREQAVEFLLDHGADANFRYTYTKEYIGLNGLESKEVTQPVIAAANNLDIIVKLLENGADKDVRNYEATPVLTYHIQARRNNAIVRALLKAGADCNISDASGSPLLNACKTNNIDAVKMLLAVGAKYFPDMYDWAKGQGHKEIEQLLTDYKNGKAPTIEEAGLDNFWESRVARMMDNPDRGKKGRIFE